MKPDLADRLTKIVLMLGGDGDGEVLNAARMLVRTLKTEGMDLHDLTVALKLSPGHVVPKNTDPTAAWAGPWPDSATEGLGLACERGYLRPWKPLAFELLKANSTIPKRYGGKCLMKHQVLILQRIQHGGTPTIDEVRAIQRMDNQIRTARRAQEADQHKAA